MREPYFRIRYQTFYLVSQRFEVLDTVVHKKYLAVSFHFPRDGIAQNDIRDRMYLCLDGLTIGWRRGDDGQIPCTHQRKMQSTWNRSGSERKCVHVHTHRSEERRVGKECR